MNLVKIVSWLINGVQSGLTMDELAQFGVVSEESTEAEGIVTVTRTFTSKDDTLTKVITVKYNKELQEEDNVEIDIKSKIAEYDDKITEAVNREDYAEAAKIKKEREQFLRS